MRTLRGTVKHYAWGDMDFIPKLLQIEPDGEPWAELWLGTHPNGPTHLDDGSPLDELSGELPYLLKVLAAGQPLSLQTHPDAAQASTGHAQGVFSDPNPKPELLYALTPFEALCGLQPAETALTLLDDLAIDQLARIVSSDGPAVALDGLYRGWIDPTPVVDACRHSSRAEASWVRRLDAMYPDDPSVAATLLLNYVVLEPGEAIRLDAGNLHAYLSGAGIELMGASDNVLRGGLTGKDVDVDALLAVVDPTPLDDPILPLAGRYELPDADVALLVMERDDERVAAGHEISVDLDGVARYCAPGDVLVATTTTYVVVPL